MAQAQREALLEAVRRLTADAKRSGAVLSQAPAIILITSLFFISTTVATLAILHIDRVRALSRCQSWVPHVPHSGTQLLCERFNAGIGKGTN